MTSALMSLVVEAIERATSATMLREQSDLALQELELKLSLPLLDPPFSSKDWYLVFPGGSSRDLLLISYLDMEMSKFLLLSPEVHEWFLERLFKYPVPWPINDFEKFANLYLSSTLPVRFLIVSLFSNSSKERWDSLYNSILRLTAVVKENSDEITREVDELRQDAVIEELAD